MMMWENASFIKSIEVDDHIFECDPQCGQKYYLQLEWDSENGSWMWKIVTKDMLKEELAKD